MLARYRAAAKARRLVRGRQRHGSAGGDVRAAGVDRGQHPHGERRRGVEVSGEGQRQGGAGAAGPPPVTLLTERPLTPGLVTSAKLDAETPEA